MVNVDIYKERELSRIESEGYINMARWNKNIPDGTRDIIYDEVLLYKNIEDKLSTVYAKNGFRQVITPAIEYYDVFDGDSRFIEQSDMYKMSDANGRLLVMRADNTMPIARLVSTKLRSARFPQKIFYTQNIYRANSHYSGKRNEILQSGVEIIGGGGLKCDLICIITALEALASLGLKFKIEIGHVGFYNALINAMNLEPDQREKIRAYVDSKNAVSLRLMKETPELDVIRRIPLLFGAGEVFAEASELSGNNKEASDTLSYVKTLYDTLVEAGYSDNIMVDMGIVHQIDYYSGVVFRGYIEGAGEPVLTGGRYDNLLHNFDFEMPATGFAVNMCIAADVLKSIDNHYIPPEYLIHFVPDCFARAESFRRSLEEKEIAAEYSCFENITDTLELARERKVGIVADVGADGVKIVEVKGI